MAALRFKFMNETVAKIIIYVLTTAMVAAFVVFLVSSRQYGNVYAETGETSSSAADGRAGTDGERVAPASDSAVGPYGLSASEASSLAGRSFEGTRSEPDIAVPPEPQPQGVAASSSSSSSAPTGVSAEGATPALAPPAADILEAEWERLRGMGVELPETVSAEYKGSYHATAYCCEVYPHICGGNGVTASGTVPTPGLTVATDWKDLPPGTWIYIQDVGIRRVEDSGSAIKGARLDVAIDTHENALRWGGFGSHEVWVLCWGDW